MTVLVNLQAWVMRQRISAVSGHGKEAAGTREHPRRGKEVVVRRGLLEPCGRLADDRRVAALGRRRPTRHQAYHEPVACRGRWRRAVGGIGQGPGGSAVRLLEKSAIGEIGSDGEIKLKGDTGRVARTQEPTQLKSSQLNSCPPVCVQCTDSRRCESSLAATYTRRKVLRGAAPAQQWPACLTDCGHGPGRSRSGLAPFFFFSRVRRGPTRGLKAKTDRVSTRSSARRPHSVRTPTTIHSFVPPLVDSGPAGGATYRNTINMPVCGLGDNHMSAEHDFMV